MTNYSRGYYGEKKTRQQLEDDGYWCCEARGSHGIADIVALKPGQILLVQVKRSEDGWVAPAKRAELVEVARSVWAEPIVAYQPKTRGPIVFRRLLGVGVGEHEDWTPDQVGAA